MTPCCLSRADTYCQQSIKYDVSECFLLDYKWVLSERVLRKVVLVQAVDDFLEDNLNLDGVQGYQFQPRWNSYTGESSESDYGNVDESVNAEQSSVTWLEKLDW